MGGVDAETAKLLLWNVGSSPLNSRENASHQGKPKNGGEKALLERTSERQFSHVPIFALSLSYLKTGVLQLLEFLL